MKRIGLSFAMAVGLFAGATAVDVPQAVAQSNTTGSVRGRIIDKKSKDAVVGATVSVSGPALQGTQTEITDENGSFNISSLPPGTYVVSVFYGDSQFNRPNVVIEVGKQAFISVPIDTEVKANEVIELVGRAPLVDQGSTKVGTTITDEYTRNIPTGRTFGAVLGTAAGTQNDTYGVSFSGSTSVESSYVVEGINTTDTAFGGQSTNLPNEFVEETEVIAGGYSAEFGRSTGGVINVVTKQGSNKFKGSVFAYYSPGTLTSDAKAILREGSSIGSETNLDYQSDLGFEVGGPIIKDKLWFHVGYNPSFTADTISRITTSVVDVDQDGVEDVDPNTGFTVLENVAQQDRGRFRTTQFFTAKVNGAISDNHQFQISGFGNPRSIDKTLYRTTGSPEASLYSIDDGAYDLAVKWTSKLNDGKTQVDLVGGYHLGFSNENPYFAGGEAAQGLQFQNLRFLGDLQQFEAVKSPKCVDGSPDDLYPMVNNCPVVNYTVNGLGFLESRDNARTSLTGSLTQRVNLAGHHAFKLGGDVEFTTYNSQRRFTGDAFYQWRRPAPGQPRQWRRRALIETDPAGVIPCLGTTCSIAPGGIQADTENRNIGLYLQDSWQVRPNFTVNAGVRWEKQTAFVAKGIQGLTSPEGEVIPEVAFELSNMIAPRVGFIWDPTSEGRAKFIAHYGRFYESVPMDINVRAFGGEITDQSFLDCPDATIDANSSTLTGCSTVSRRTQLGGGTEYVAPSMRGQYINEVILGAEYELMADFKMGINFVGRNMPIVIEDVSTDGGNNYLIANPGEDFSSDASSLRAQADSIMATDPDLAALYNSRADQLDSVKDFDKPVRDYQAVQFTAQQRLSKHAMLLASYTYARSKGNYPGLFSTETGQLDPNLTSLYDLPELMSNRYGALGLDRPHNLKVDGFYQFDFKQAGLLTLGASVRGQSGIAHNTLGAHVFYGTDESYILPRGSDLRSPFTWTGDVKATYGRRIGKNQSVEVFADIFNLFNNQDETDADETYTFDAIDPIVGGDSSDLAHAKQQGVNETPNLNKNYGNLNARQAPRSIRFGLRYSF
ncbi:MAG: TonB-dependent receptor [Kofleriaceae bacterium]